MNIAGVKYELLFNCKFLNNNHLNYYVDTKDKIINIKHILNIDTNVLGSKERYIKAQIHQFMEYKRKAIAEAYIHELCEQRGIYDINVPPLLLNSPIYTIQRIFPNEYMQLIDELKDIYHKEHCDTDEAYTITI